MNISTVSVKLNKSCIRERIIPTEIKTMQSSLIAKQLLSSFLIAEIHVSSYNVIGYSFINIGIKGVRADGMVDDLARS